MASFNVLDPTDTSLTTARLVLMLEKAGADIVELGVPFTDPLADGPTIQRAAERALAAGVTLKKVIAIVRELRSQSRMPLILMTYYNPVFRYGEEQFVRDAASAGVDGVIIPDLPPDEAGGLMKLSRKTGLDIIFLLAPTSTDERIKKAAKSGRGFIYYVSMTGITGSRLVIDGSVEQAIGNIRRLTDKPVAVGFGVSTPEEAGTISKVSDGVIVGSAIVKKIHEAPAEVEEFVVNLRKAI